MLVALMLTNSHCKAPLCKPSITTCVQVALSQSWN